MSKFKLNSTQGIILCKAKLTNRRQSIFIKLAVDTGASFSMISIESALAIKIDPSKSTRRIEITTANGIILAPIIKIPSFNCFGVEVKNIDIICHNLPLESCVEHTLTYLHLHQKQHTALSLSFVIVTELEILQIQLQLQLSHN